MTSLTGCRHFDEMDLQRRWLGRLDSNQGMAVPKTAALPLGYAPTVPANVMIEAPTALRIAFSKALARPQSALISFLTFWMIASTCN